MVYAIAAELAQWMDITITIGSAQEARANFLIDAAGGVIEDEAGQRLEQSTDTETLDGSGTRKLVLPRWPVTAVTSVTLLKKLTDLTDDKLLVADTDYTWSKAGILTRKGGVWPCDDQSVKVVDQAGYQPIPKVLKRVALRLAAGAWNNPGAVESESLGSWSTKYVAGGGALGMELTKGEKRTVSGYRART